jgi:ribosomal protein S12 methylthiotransferase accessory factor
MSREAALASGMMEGLETFHAESIGSPIHFGSASELARDAPVTDWHRLPVYSGRTVDRAERIPWIAATQIDSNRRCLLPLELVSADFTEPGLRGFGIFLQSTNGLASGNAYEEAIVHGICELVERDALSHWRRLSARDRAKTFVSPEQVTRGDAVKPIELFAANDFDVAIWNITTELEIPTYHCVVRDRHGVEHHGSGTGCHPSPDTALTRALTEAAQVRLTYVSGARDDIDRFDYSTEMRRRSFAELSHEIELGRANSEATFDTEDGRTSPDIDDDLDWLKARLNSVLGFGIYVVDLSKEDIGIPVVKVVVPGLLGPEFFPGELVTPSDRTPFGRLS